MSARRAELVALTTRFVDAFNQQDLDGVMRFFSPEAVYEDSRGGSHTGHAAIRAAFEPLLNGARGRIRFDEEDFFTEVETDKVMASWRLHMEIDGKPVSMRGLDLLHFEGEHLVRKLAYCKSASPTLDRDA